MRYDCGRPGGAGHTSLIHDRLDRQTAGQIKYFNRTDFGKFAILMPAAAANTVTQAENFSRLKELLEKEFDIDPAAISLDARLSEDLDIDSIDAIDMIVRLKEITGRKVPPERFKEVRTVGDIVQLLDSL
jgi:acyl carrier protein